MKGSLHILSGFLAFACLFGGVIAFSSCDKADKYSYQKYEDIAYGEYERQVLDLCLPNDRDGDLGLILVIHGGAWIGGDKSNCTKNIEKWCGEYGYATAAISYHYISSEFSCDDIMEDIALSLEKIKSFAAEKGINIEKTMLVGNSAGGHLSLLYAYKYADTSPIKPVAVANYSGPTYLCDENYYNNENAAGYLDLFSRLCHSTITEENYLSEEMQSALLRVSPVSYIDQNTVPTLICHGQQDDVVPYSNAEILKRQLDLYGVKNDFVSYPNSGHSLGADKKQSNEAKKLFAEYAKTYLG